MANHKRKRDEDDSDDDPSYGMRQILPVASLPANFDGEPMDGMQYLFTVRRDAKLLPPVTRVPNPYEFALRVASPGSAELPDNGMNGVVQNRLSSEWRATYTRRFQSFRENLNQPTSGSPAPTQSKLMPEKKDREAWWDFVCGAPESVWNKAPSKRSTKPKRKSGGGLYGELDPSDPNVAAAGWQIVQPSSRPSFDVIHPTHVAPTSSGLDLVELSPSMPTKPREPTPALILSIDHRMAIHLIMYFTFWINQHLEAPNRMNIDATESYTPLESHARWIFALLARVDSYCSADDMNGLRSLVRACLAYKRSRNALAVKPPPNNDGGDADSDIASTPGDQPVSLPPLEEPVKPASKQSHIEGKEAPAVDAPSQNLPAMSANSVRLILCAVADFWHQRDLWADAEGAFT